MLEIVGYETKDGPKCVACTAPEERDIKPNERKLIVEGALTPVDIHCVDCDAIVAYGVFPMLGVNL